KSGGAPAASRLRAPHWISGRDNDPAWSPRFCRERTAGTAPHFQRLVDGVWLAPLAARGLFGLQHVLQDDCLIVRLVLGAEEQGRRAAGALLAEGGHGIRLLLEFRPIALFEFLPVCD